jgi:phosphatidylserine/phosphatidylglycerophosphate/cardiolipin synthase-like enzyme
MLLAACTSATDQLEEITLDRDDRLQCSPDDATRCAEPSPLQALRDAVSAEPGTHYVSIINIGEHSLQARLHLIRSARASIYIQQYIWRADGAGRLLLIELIKAARRGVDVKVIGDQLNTIGDPGLMATLVQSHANFGIKIYNPTFNLLRSDKLGLILGGLMKLGRSNHRMHSKLLVIDDEVAILGGRNHQDRYFDLDPTYYFKDRDVMVIGPAVRDMSESFLDFWQSRFSVSAQRLTDVRARLDAGDLVPLEASLPAQPMLRDIDRAASDRSSIHDRFVAPAFRITGRVAFFADPPISRYAAFDDPRTRPTDSVYQGIIDLRSEVEDEIILQTPYLIFRQRAFEELARLRNENPQLRVLASTNSLASIDSYAPFAIMIKQRRRILQELGFQIFEFKPEPGDVSAMIPRYMQIQASTSTPVSSDATDTKNPPKPVKPVVGMHAKSIVIDGRVAFVGTHNFDPRSASFNTEIALVVWDPPLAQALRADILRDMAPQNSWVVAKQEGAPLIAPVTQIFGDVSRGLPLLDLWPFRYAAGFELRPGEKPVPPGHPEFYRRYDNVGQFPGVAGNAKAIQARLFGILGNLTAPYM